MPVAATRPCAQRPAESDAAQRNAALAAVITLRGRYLFTHTSTAPFSPPSLTQPRRLACLAIQAAATESQQTRPWTPSSSATEILKDAHQRSGRTTSRRRALSPLTRHPRPTRAHMANKTVEYHRFDNYRRIGPTVNRCRLRTRSSSVRFGGVRCSAPS